ncbi:unnamed protein product [Sphagnum balticum]
MVLIAGGSWVRSLANGFVRLATQPLRGNVLATNPAITVVLVCQHRPAIEVVKHKGVGMLMALAWRDALLSFHELGPKLMLFACLKEALTNNKVVVLGDFSVELGSACFSPLSDQHLLQTPLGPFGNMATCRHPLLEPNHRAVFGREVANLPSWASDPEQEWGHFVMVMSATIAKTVGMQGPVRPDVVLAHFSEHFVQVLGDGKDITDEVREQLNVVVKNIEGVLLAQGDGTRVTEEPTLAEVQACVKCLHDIVAPGEDGITTPLLKACPKGIKWSHQVILVV